MSSVLIICDGRLPAELKANLRKYGDVLSFATKGIVYDAISGHPDIFFHRSGKKVVCAPCTPPAYLDALARVGAELIKGESRLGDKYPQTVYYNAVAGEKYLYCNSQYVDSRVVGLHAGKEIFHLNQGYVACNMVVGGNTVLTSDAGIAKALNAAFFDPAEIILKGVNHGFIGGSCFVTDDMLLLNGSLRFVSQRDKILKFAEENNLKIIELYNGPLIDGGGLLVIG